LLFFSRDKDELESIIKLLITDNVVRKKFSGKENFSIEELIMIDLDWKFTHEPFNSFEISNEFQERYIPTPINIRKVEEEQEIKPSKRTISLAG
jgi:hypothetical protein